jgi:replicative DNA helicase
MNDVRMVPRNESAEHSVLGAMLINPQNVIPPVTEMLTGGDFYNSSDGEIFHTIVSMWLEDEGSVDTVTVGNRFPSRADYIHTLAEFCPTASNVKYYADIVKRDSTARSLIAAGNEIVELGYNEEEETSKLIDTAESKLSGLRTDTRKHTYRINELGDTILRNIESGVKPKKISTGFESIDKYAKGLYAGNFIIIGARPGVGKTCLGLSVAQKVASTGGTVAFFSLEMKANELMERLLASIACVSLTKIRENSLSEAELVEIYKAREALDSHDLRLVDDSTITMLEICSRVRALSKSSDLRLVVVDYLQLGRMGSKVENRREEVSEMSRKLKSLAMEVNVPIIALSQLNRVSTFDGTKVDIAQLKESGSLEQDADQVWLMSWPKQESFDTKSVEVEIAKNRHGPMGTAELIWLPQYQKYEE